MSLLVKASSEMLLFRRRYVLDGLHRKHSPIIHLFCQTGYNFLHPRQVYSRSLSCIHFHSQVWKTGRSSTGCVTYNLCSAAFISPLSNRNSGVCIRHAMYYFFCHTSLWLLHQVSKWSELQSIHSRKKFSLALPGKRLCPDGRKQP